MEHTPDMYLVKGPWNIKISLICATFETMEPELGEVKLTQRRTFQILWNLISTDFKPVCTSVQVLANSVTSVPV